MRISKQSSHSAAQQKREIQGLLREIKIKEQGGKCFLYKKRGCGGEVGKEVMQFDHLVSRGNSASFADPRLGVLLCRPCHGGWKQWHKPDYDRLVKSILPKEIVELWERVEADKKPYRMDWKLEIVYLKSKLKGLST